ncbi:Zn(2)-C6 fungal-type domain-containing protein [Mycena indigotica]|uniref:Zn(2)-C6 fungal-type domain-containing protein n=1 Tax=Mycena indigotica TaxID=2126181 RepID=A0A8H6W3H7_9AGAR|nr:Zn(2)-C6 fungal-type domain-containing protein [Mycena indigotica]KAF7303617.1 Zn(2)-C6 fungal-type domain-containing protein [Mycena indigotica]
MSTAPYPTKRLHKPPACDSCKARRVLCHPQPNGAPCPRCAERNVVCTTTPTSRGRPRKNHVTPTPQQPQPITGPSMSSLTLISPQVHEKLADCPTLTPELVSHLFDCFDHLPQVLHPLIRVTLIKSSIRSVSFQLHLLPTELRVLALSIMAHSSTISYHEAILGSAEPRPKSFDDALFFSSSANIRLCGVRRAAACRALHATALRAAWDTGAMLQVSNANAATCFFLDLLEQNDFEGLSRPWASAYMSHVRALAPLWRACGTAERDEVGWAGFLMAEMLLSTRSKKPALVSFEDQILLSGGEPTTLETLLASIEAAAHKPGVKPLYQAMKPYMFHVTCLARQLWQTVTGDHARLTPLSESSAIQALNALGLLHSIATHLLTRADSILSPYPRPHTPFVISEPTEERAVRGCTYIIIMGFVGLVLSLYQALDDRTSPDSKTPNTSSSITQISPSSTSLKLALPQQKSNVDSPLQRARRKLLTDQARQLARAAVQELARAIDYLPTIHYVPTQLHTLRNYALFAMEELQTGLTSGCDEDEELSLKQELKNLTTIASQLAMTGYSLDIAGSLTTGPIIDRVQSFVGEFSIPSDGHVLEEHSQLALHLPSEPHAVPAYPFMEPLPDIALPMDFLQMPRADEAWMSTMQPHPEY